MTVVPAHISCFHAAKEGSGEHEYEDAAWPLRDTELTDARGLLAAVADGASESFLADRWARLLVETWGNQQAVSVTRFVLTSLQGWKTLAAEYRSERDELAWWQEMKLFDGAHATFCGVALGWRPTSGDADRRSPHPPQLPRAAGTAPTSEDIALPEAPDIPDAPGAIATTAGTTTMAPAAAEPEATTTPRTCESTPAWVDEAPHPDAPIDWGAIAVGDACLFHVADDALATAFPIDDPDTFGTTPALLQSVPPNRQAVLRSIQTARGRCGSGDTLYLATDALAAWFLQSFRDDGGAEAAPWQVWRNFGTDEGDSFGDWLNKARRDRRIRNDDSTLIRIDLC